MRTRRSVRLLFATALLLAWARGAAAQSPCEDALREASKSYDLGLFEDVPTKLSPCLGTQTSRSVAIQVHSLLARAYLANEEPDQARKEISTLLRLQSNYEPEAGSSARLVAMLAQVRAEEQTTQVASVSKTSESLREAPATVVVITADEIQRRGYLDLEQLLHDLPGFDISRSNGSFYSTIYQRGYNAPSNDRNLLLVDGVEQNDLSFGTVYLSRQYPLTNIDRVEVIYGPASTMYGANAYTGVISIITKAPEAMIKEGKPFALAGQVTGGGYGSDYADVTAAGTDSSGTVAWSLAGNFQQSKERNLSSLDSWSYTYDHVDYRSLTHLAGTPAERAVLCVTPSPYIQCDATGISLTDKGVDLVRGLDRGLVQNNGLGFNDRAKNWSLYGTLRLSNLTIGVQSWRSQEGIISAFGSIFGGSSVWTPRETALYLKYSLPLGVVKVNVFTRYIQTSYDKAATELDALHMYASGALNLFSLVPPCQSLFDPKPVDCAPAKPWVETVHYGLLSTQLRSEINVTYDSSRIAAVSGLEFAKSEIQNERDQTSSGLGQLSALPLEAPQQTQHTDIAIYGQGSYKFRPSLKLVLAGRLTHNEINDKPGVSGFGTLFTPRAALIYSPVGRHIILKSIYSEAFKDPTDAQKFGVFNQFLNAFRSNGLRPEKVRNAELSAGWNPNDRLSVQGSLYQANYSQVVAYGYPLLPDGSPVPPAECIIGCQQFQNRDSIRIRGLQMTTQYRYRNSDLWGNYTHTESFQTNPTDFFGNPIVNAQGQPVKELPVAGIARDHVNAGVDIHWSNRLKTDLHAEYVSPRRTGTGTTLPFPDAATASYATLNVALSYDHVLPNTALQVIAFNLLNRNYYDPATDTTNVARILQPGRTVYLRLIYDLSKR